MASPLHSPHPRHMPCLSSPHGLCLLEASTSLSSRLQLAHHLLRESVCSSKSLGHLSTSLLNMRYSLPAQGFPCLIPVPSISLCDEGHEDEAWCPCTPGPLCLDSPGPERSSGVCKLSIKKGNKDYLSPPSWASLRLNRLSRTMSLPGEYGLPG